MGRGSGISGLGPAQGPVAADCTFGSSHRDIIAGCRPPRTANQCQRGEICAQDRSSHQRTPRLSSSRGAIHRPRPRYTFCDARKRSRAHLPASAWPQAASRHGQWQGGVECHLVAGPQRAPSVSIALHWFSRRHSRARTAQLEHVLGPLAASSASIARLPRSWLMLTLGGAPSEGGVEARP